MAKTFLEEELEKRFYIKDGIYYLRKSIEKKPNVCAARYCRKIPWGKEKFCSRCKSMLWRIRHPIHYMLKNLKDSARKRGIPFHLELDEFTDWVLNTAYPLARGCQANMLHIDRIRNWEGYTINNIQILTCRENVEKERKEYSDDPF